MAEEDSEGLNKNAVIGAVVVLLVLLFPGYGIFTWFFSRIEVPPEHVAVLIAKTGDNLPAGHVIARSATQKGIQRDVLLPGRHFRNPLFWDWEIHRYVDIKQGEVGVLTRQYGDSPDLAKGLLVPYDETQGEWKGIVTEVLKPGQYPLNPYAYAVQPFKATEVLAGFVGVTCDRVGTRAKTSNTYLVEKGERGVQKEVLGQGSHYLNPYAISVYLVDIRSQRLEFSDDPRTKDKGKGLTALRFPSSDGFEIEAHLTVEWSIDAKRAPEVFVRIGTGDPKTLMEEVLYKTLIPALRGLARIQGSKVPASSYISGESRTVFQDKIFKGLQEACGKQGIIIHSVLVNDIEPPNDIAGPIRAREVAKEELSRNKVQLRQAKAEQSLARQTILVQQETARVTAETEMEKRKIKVKNQQAVGLIEQDKLLKVAKADLAAAKLQAEAILARGKAEAAVVVANNEAEAQALKTSVAAFPTPSGFALYTFAQRMAPSVRAVFANPDGPFGQLFRDLLKPGTAAGAARTRKGGK